MFGRPRPREVVDAQLGALIRSRGRWRGRLDVGVAPPVPLSLPGNRHEPDPGALGVATTIPDRFAEWLPAIAVALVEHAEPVVGEPDAPTIDADGEARRPVYVAVIEFEGQPTIELGYRVPWDPEHTLGARIRDGRLVELSGSVLEP